jgi:hypothetical protein
MILVNWRAEISGRQPVAGLAQIGGDGVERAQTVPRETGLKPRRDFAIHGNCVFSGRFFNAAAQLFANAQVRLNDGERHPGTTR